MPTSTEAAEPVVERHPRTAGRCPNCVSGRVEPFYSIAGIPAHSVLLMHDREQAVSYPRGDLSLGWCPACGFVTNTLFDVSLNAYSPDYEETQHFSPAFDSWARQLIDRLIRDYDLRGKRIVEIGCGKGEFLQLLCEAGDNHGVGIDPSCRPERLTDPRVRLIRDLYSDTFQGLPADVICCRHTLEHIQPTYEFLRMVRRVVGDRPETLMFFEVPDTRRVLKERAFWDVYYEHCSYFTAGSLARLFRASGFEIVELVRDFADQYLWVTARPAVGPTRPMLAIEDDIEETRADVAAFQQQCPRDVAAWRERIQRDAAAGRKVVVWGAGSKCVAFLTTTGIRAEVEYLVDINPYKTGKYLPGTGHAVVAPGFLREYRPDVVVAMNPVYVEEIRRALSAIDVSADVVAV